MVIKLAGCSVAHKSLIFSLRTEVPHQSIHVRQEELTDSSLASFSGLIPRQ